MMAAFPALAGVQEFTVTGVGVDSFSPTAAEKSVDYAKKRAVFLAATKLGVANAGKAVSKIPPEAMAEIIRGTTIMQTRREKDVTYTQVNVSIVTEALQRALKLPEPTPPQPEHTRGVLLLSAYITPSKTYMWQTENILRAPLAEQIQRQARGSVMLSGADLEDLRLVDHENVMDVTAEALKPMFERYGADEILIALMTPGTEGTTEPSGILLRRLKLAETRSEVMQIPPDDAKDPIEKRVAKAATAIAAAATQIAASTSEQDRARIAKATKIPVRFEYATPARLAVTQAIVRTAPKVLLLELPSIALGDVSGAIYLEGDKAELLVWLTKKGLTITPADEGWKIAPQ